MEKKLIGVIVLALVLIAGLAFFSQSTPTGAFVAQDQTQNLVTVGASLALTGKAASYGQDIRNGMELALGDINKSGQKLYLRVLFDDTQSVPEKAVTSAKKFIEIDGAKAIIEVGADDVLATVPVTEASKVILATPIGGSDKIDGAGKYVFRNREPSKATAYALAELIFAKGYKEAALFIATSSSPISYSESFLEKYSSLGGFAQRYNYSETSVDVRTSITKIKEGGIGAVYVVASKDKDGSEIVKQLKEMGYSGLIVGGPALETQAFFESARESVEGVIIAVAPVDVNAPNAKEILQEYKSTYGKEMVFSAANAYDLIIILNKAAGLCGEDTDCIRQYLLAVKDYPGMGGRTTFNLNGGVTKPMSYKIATEGKFVLYEGS